MSFLTLPTYVGDCRDTESFPCRQGFSFRFYAFNPKTETDDRFVFGTIDNVGI